jgi:D-alanyl-D-alanine carboxypeptidase
MIRGELIELQSSYGFPGMTFAYILPDGTASSGAIGWADKEKKRKMTSQNRMLAASIGKSFVSAVILQLAHEHRITLDDSLEKWLGDRPWFLRLPNHSKITLRHLLTHTSGLPDHVHMTAFLNAYAKRWQKPNSPFNHEELVGFVLDQPPLFESGKGWMYTDTGYILLGLVIESVTHHSYEYELDKRFLQPLHLKDTSPSDRPDLDRLAAGYTMPNNPFGLPIKTLAETNVMAWNPAFEWTGGGLVSTSLDLARWVKLLCEGHAMKGEYVHTLFQRVSAGSGLYYGAGITVTENDSFGLIYGHWGVIPGYVSSMRYFSKCGVACAFQINTDIGVSGHSTHLLNEMEERIAKIIVSYVQNHLHRIDLFRN